MVDDGSTDGSLEELEGLPPAPFPVRVLRQANAGQSAARNAAARQAEGEFLAFLDQDDHWHPRHLEELVAPLVDDPSVGWVYSDFDEMDLDGQPGDPRLHPRAGRAVIPSTRSSIAWPAT